MIRPILYILFCLTMTTLHGQDNLVFLDEFEDNRWGWAEFSNENAAAFLNFGRYQFEHKREEGSWSVFKSIALNDAKDWRFLIEMGHLEGVDNYGYSFLFGREEDNYFQLSLSGNGYFSISEYANGKFISIVDWVERKEVVNGSGLLNTIEIFQKNDQWNFSINDGQIHTMPARELYGNGIGFNVSRMQAMTIASIKVYQDESLIKTVPDVPFDLLKENLGRSINTEWYEKMPVIAPDGKTLYFTRDDYPLNVDNRYDDIWYAKREDNTWTKAEPMPYPLNQAFNNSVISVTPDNNSLMLLNRYDPDGKGSAGTGLSISNKESDGWSIPQDIQIDDYYNNSVYTESNLSNNRQAIIITLNREDTQNAKEKEYRDIYICLRKDDGSFSAPLNAGPDINTIGDETSPFLAADNKTLYFSSTGWPGYGSSDIFVTKRLDDSWTKWSEPRNLGMGINTSGWDAYFSIPASGAYAYLISANNSIGGGDVFRVKLPPNLLPEPVVLVSGIIYDSKSDKPIGADVSYTDLLSGEQLGIATSDPKDGSYQIVLPLGKQYAFRGEKSGYYPVSENLDVRELDEYREVTKDLYMTPLEVGQTVRINNIFFEFNKSELKEESFEELNLLVRILNDNPGLTIELGGHTDSKGSNDYNLNLSTARAASVKTYLLDKGIAADRLVSKGYGETKPIADNATEEGQALNRRVEFTIMQ